MSHRQEMIDMLNNAGESRHGSVLGKTVKGTLERPEAIPLPPGRSFLGTVTMVSSFFVSWCPETGQPDHGTVTIRFTPAHHILESKSLKLYLLSFNNPDKPGMAEGLARRICDEVYEVLQPQDITVIVVQSPRGDIGITAEAFRSAGWSDEFFDPVIPV